MTVKSNRAGNIRKLTDAEVQLTAIKGGAVDESVPASGVACMKANGWIAEREAFAAFLGRSLGRYRLHCADVVQRLPMAREVAITAETLALIEELRQRLDHVPETVQANADVAAWNRGGTWDVLQQTADAHLREVWMVLSLGIRESEQLKGNKGAKATWHRDLLVRDVMAEIGRVSPARTKKIETAAFAHELLRACDVPVPDDLAEFAKLARKAGKN